MKSISKIFRFYLAFQTLVILIMLLYLLFVNWNFVNSNTIILVSFLWLDFTFLAVSILFWIVKLRKKRDVINYKEMIYTIILNGIFLIVFFFDPFHLMSIALG